MGQSHPEIEELDIDVVIDPSTHTPELDELFTEVLFVRDKFPL